jgi:hypothetical protein
MALFDSCWRFRDGADHIEVEAYPRCVEPEQRVRSLMELGGLLHRFAAADVAVRTVMLDVHGRLSGQRASGVDALSTLAWMREDLVSAATAGTLVVRRAPVPPAPACPLEDDRPSVVPSSGVRTRSPGGETR